MRSLPRGRPTVLAAVQQRVTTDFKIAHGTVQVERKECAAHEVHL
jgi:hypothetical protein